MPAGGTHLELEIVCIDDSTEILDIYSQLFSDFGYKLVLLSDPSSAVEHIQNHSENILIIISDLKMGSVAGTDIRKAILARYSEIPFILISGFITKEIKKNSENLNISKYFEKPFDLQELRETIQFICDKRKKELKDQHEILLGFVEESLPLLEKIENINLELDEKNKDDDSFKEYLRILHTLKGTASGLKLIDMASFIHHYEDFVIQINRALIPLNTTHLNYLYQAIDALKAMMLMVREGRYNGYEKLPIKNLFKVELSDSKPSDDLNSLSKQSQEKSPENSASEKLMVPAELLDQFVEATGNLTMIMSTISSTLERIRQKYPQDQDINMLFDAIAQVKHENSFLQNSAEGLRKVPVGLVFKPFRRTVRDLAASLNKKVKLKLEGEDLRIDKAIAKALSNSLIHLLRNSLDHGIENPEERKKIGKSEEGNILCLIHQIADVIEVKISDDGKGMDVERIKSKALEKKLKTVSELSKMSEQEILGIIFEPGFSTAEKVNQVSGRGVGMDMVKNSVQEFNGKITVQSKLGNGSEICIQIPIPKSCLILKVIFVSINNKIFAVPQGELIRIVKPTQKNIFKIEGANCLEFQGVYLPILNLSNTNNQINDPQSSLMILGRDDKYYAFLIQNIIKMEEAVIRDLDIYSKIEAYPFMQAALEGQKNVAPILNCEILQKISKSENRFKQTTSPRLGA